MKKRLLAGLLLCTVLLCSLTACGKPQSFTAYSFDYFDTVTTIVGYAADQEEFDSISDSILSELGEYHRLFTTYHRYEGLENLCTINELVDGAHRTVTVDRRIIDMLLYARDMYEKTDGAVNIAMGSVLSIWHDAREKADARGGVLNAKDLPTEEALRAAAEHTAIDSLVIDKTAKTVYMSDPLASIDVGAIAKGYAAAKLADKLKAMGADSMAINAGGNIITIGLKPGGVKWVTGITNPDKSADSPLICKVALGETALVTSGDYERYFECGGKTYHHIIDPATLMPADYFASVSIFTANSGLADALSTALFCMSYEEGLALAEQIGGVEVLWIYPDGTMKMTNGVTITE